MPTPKQRTLYVVYGGGNDLLAAVGRPDGPAMVDRAVAALRTVLDDLIERQATDILVPNLPDMGMMPAIRRQGGVAVAEAGRLTLRFNETLERVSTEVVKRASTRLHRLDVWALGERARADPAAFGFVDIVTPCERLPTCRGHLFWDDVHPTTHAHGRLAEAAFHAVSP
jgi:outer membrane lipase/esterase